jgi:hypothetical protein
MGGPGFSWTTLTPSLTRQRWLLGATVVCVVLAAVFTVRFVASPTIGLGIAAVASGVAAVAAGWCLVRPEPSSMVKIDGAGSVWRRAVGDDASAGERLSPSVVSRHLMTFTGGAVPIAIWHDNLPADRFRRLCSHARWHVDRSRQGTGPESDEQPPPA